MTGYSFKKIFTSHARWLIGLIGFLLLGHKTLLITLPLSRNQLLWQRNPKSTFVTLRISSYFDWATIHEIFIRREYALDNFPQNEVVQKAYRSHIEAKQTPLILDLGANIGVASKFFSAEYPGAMIVAVEPSEANQISLKRNLPGSNFSIRHAAVGFEAGNLELRDPGLGNNAFRTYGDGKVVGTVPQVTVDELIAPYPNCPLLLVKVDIEGFESALFSGNTDWIDNAKVIAIETHDWMLPGKGISQNLINALAGRNRDLVFQGENLFSIRND